MRRAVEGRDTLALMPTGAGKSLCYQLAAMLRPTPTLVISPLIALMKDQIDNLPPGVQPHATLINSSLDPVEAARRLQGLAAGQYKLLYAAPERLRQRQFVAALRSVNVGLVVIDEVHCVSMWGHDFRPDYMFIRTALKEIGEPPVLGLTATATPTTERDIAQSLGREFEVVRSSVVRSNLRYEVQHVENEEGRLRSALAHARRFSGSGIIYARSREKCEQVPSVLERNGVRALHYHAGLDSRDRARVQESFLADRARVIVATTAFGMGIDKRDIRWVLLYNFPNSLESYVQMVGRAGRDGEKSTCILLASGPDATNLRRFARTDIPAIEQLRLVYRALRRGGVDGWVEAEASELASEAGVGDESTPRVLVAMLERAELLRRDYDVGPAMRMKLTLPAPEDTPKRIAELLGSYETQALAHAERMIQFADARACRHLQVAQHFGESVAVPCGMCDVCAPDAHAGTASPTAEARPLPTDIGRVVVDAVEGFSWPLGLKGLVLMLKGSLAAPRSAQRAEAFGALAAAREGTIKRWVEQLLDRGNLEFFEEDGYRLIRVGENTDLPRLASLPAPRAAEKSGPSRNGSETTPGSDGTLAGGDAELFERLRAWRTRKAQELGLPAYTILHNQALQELASLRPTDLDQLGHISGIGPAKIEKYGGEVLALVMGTSVSPAD